MNQVILHGRIAKEIDNRTTSDGLAITRLSIATQNTYKNKSGEVVKHVDYTNVVFMGGSAATIAKHFNKGDGIIVTGRLTSRSYEVDGQKKYITEVVGSTFEFPFGKPIVNQSTEHLRSEDAVAEVVADEDDLPF